MLSSVVALFRHRAAGGRRGSVATIMGLTAVPLVIAMGVGLDMSRLVVAKSALQHAADKAALAGATAYLSDQAPGDATTVANKYFDTSAQGLSATVTQRTATAAAGQLPGGAASFNVTVDATATLPMTLMAVAKVSSMTIKAHAVATNPNTTSTAGGGGTGGGAGNSSEQPVVTMGPIGSSAADWNSVYMYAVPNGADGKPDYNAGKPDYNAPYPPRAQFYEAGSNCNSSNNSWTSNSRCNSFGQFGATVPATQNFPMISNTVALAFLFVNMNNGEYPSSSQGYGPNQYGAAPNNIEIFRTADMSLNKSPSFLTDDSVATVKQLTTIQLVQTATNYSALNKTATPNCAVQIALVLDPKKVPTEPPYPGVCFSTTDPRSGYQYANMSCSQMAGRTFIYWWNDMGGHGDDYDYKNLYFTVRCVQGSTNPNGGTLYTGTPQSGSAVSLIQ